MLSPSDFNNAVPQFTNGDYANNPINPQYIAEPGAVDYNRGAEPLQTLPAQWWNWFLNRFTNRFNKINIYVKNIFNELTQLLSLVSVSPSGTEGSPTVGQLKDMFENKYPSYLALLMYPVGSIYWTSKAPDDGGDPNELFGGTWVQIKNCFIWAKGDNDALNATGGSKTVTLTEQQIPSHNHSFTPSGSISVTTNPTFTGSAVNTDSKGSHSHTTNSQSTSSVRTSTKIYNSSNTEITNTGGMSGNSTGTLLADFMNRGAWTPGSGNVSYDKKDDFYISGGGAINATYTYTINVAHTHNMQHNHTVNISHTHGTDSQGAHTHSVTASGTISGGAYKFTGTAGSTGSKGYGNAHDNMPPYIVKYCWERTA